MEYRCLGRTGIRVSAVSFGAGPISGLMTGSDAELQRQTVAQALAAGMNWFDTAATYGNGQSERSLGAALRDLSAANANVATKVRLMPDELHDIPGSIQRSVAGSLERLGLERVALLQLHNSITARRGDQHTSITPHDVLGVHGVLETFASLRSTGLVQHVGLTGLGDLPSLLEVVRSGGFDTIQATYNLLNPSAGQAVEPDFEETDYGNLIEHCAAQRMGVIAIRVFAGGALVGQEPSPHTLTTRFFPLDLYQRDRQRADALASTLPAGMSLKEAAVRFVLGHPHVSTALIGLGNPAQVDEAVACVRNVV